MNASSANYQISVSCVAVEIATVRLPSARVKVHRTPPFWLWIEHHTTQISLRPFLWPTAQKNWGWGVLSLEGGPNPLSVGGKKKNRNKSFPPCSGHAKWVFGHFQVSNFFEFDFVGAFSKLEPQLRCDLTGLVMHTHPVHTLQSPIKGSTSQRLAGEVGELPPISSDPSGTVWQSKYRARALQNSR